MRILYFGIYNPEYSRNRVLIKGLRENGVEVIECSDRSRSVFKYTRLIFKFLRLRTSFDVMVVGFPGQEVMLLARLLTRKPIIFDAFTSHYGGHILDRGTHSRSSLRAAYYKWIDRRSCLLADMVLLDTTAHIEFFVREFNLSPEKFKRIFVGTDSSIFYPRPLREHKELQIHFHGNFIPLQGISRIIEAAKILEHDPIQFNIVGRGQTYMADTALAEELGLTNIAFIDPVHYRDLPNFMEMADMCLGIFGTTPKTDLVIPNKIFEAIAMGKPVITADTSAVRELLKDKEHVILCQKGSAQSLADAIRTYAGLPDERSAIGHAGRRLFEAVLTEKHLAKELLDVIQERRLVSK
jgi:glycosyltransferase involved in cell wall biosynthesis